MYDMLLKPGIRVEDLLVEHTQAEELHHQEAQNPPYQRFPAHHQVPS
jgi:hypothetical protein